MTVATAGSLGLLAVISDSTGVNWSGPGNGYGNEVEVQSNRAQASFTRIWASAGATGTASVSQTNGDFNAHQIALKPAGQGTTVYTGPITITDDTTLKARAYRVGWGDSALLSETYTFGAVPPDPPAFAPPGGEYDTPQDVVLTSTPGSTIHYTIDGTDPDDTDPSVASGGSVLVGQPLTLRAKAYSAGGESAITQASYTFKVGLPVATPSGGTHPAPIQVSLATVTPAAEIRYTLDGTDPGPGSPLYSAPIDVSASLTLKARAFRAGWTDSDFLTESYTIQQALDPPTFSPPGGTFVTSVEVTLTAQAGATIHYTTDGNDPTAQSPVYSGPLTFDVTTTLKAKAIQSGWTDSPTATDTYTIQVATPTLSPPGGTFTGPVDVTLTTVTPGATIHYTLDESDPDETDPSVSSGGVVTIDADVTLKAKAFKPGTLPSGTVTGSFSATLGELSAPVFNPAPGLYVTEVTVAITGGAGATIHYTVDGNEPTEASPIYATPLDIDLTTTLKAKAFQAGWTPSQTTTGEYEIQAATPILSPPGGSFVGPVDVTLTTATPGATIHYTTDGSDPDANDASVPSGGVVAIDQTVELRAVAIKTGTTASGIATGNYQATLGQLDPPVPGSPPGVYPPSLALTLSCSSGIPHFTLDGSDPDGASPAYTQPIVIDLSLTVKAACFLAGWTPSAVWTGSYEIQLTPPSFAPSGGTFPGPVEVTLSSPTAGAAIRFTLDGSEPDGSSTLYTDPLSIVATTTVKAKALKPGTTPSPTATETYTIQAGLSAPVASPAPGTFPGPVDVTFDVPGAPGAEVRVTTDGSDPDETSWLVGQGTPIRLQRTATLRARAFEGGSSSAVTQAAYSIDTGFVAAGDLHSFVSWESGEVYGWGLNDVLQVGSGADDPQLIPFLLNLPGPPSWLGGGTAHSAAIIDGQLWTWGDNALGQLGTDDLPATQTGTPQLVDLPGRVVHAAAGLEHQLALLEDGSVWAWGDNSSGQLGDGSTTARYAPVEVASLGDVVSVAAGERHSLALRADGTVWTWGTNDYGQLGNGAGPESPVPVEVTALSGVVSIASGHLALTSFAVLSDGTLVGWGYNESGELGTDNPTLSEPVPIPVVGVSSPRHLSVGGNHTLALLDDGTVWSWGANWDGQLGDGSTEDDATPKPVPDIADVVDVAAGGAHSLALLSDGTLLVWGRNEEGQLGLGDTDERQTPEPPGTSTPVATPEPGSFAETVEVALVADPGATIRYTTNGDVPTEASSEYTGALTFDVTTTLKARAFLTGSLPSAVFTGVYDILAATPQFSVASGFLAVPQDVTITSATPGATIHYTTDLTEPSETSASIPSGGSVTVDQTVVIRARAYAPGLSPSGVATAFYQLDSVGQVSAGEKHSLVLHADGTVWAFGNNEFGQLGDSTTQARLTPTQVEGLSDVVAVAASARHSLALRSDGTVHSWGDDTLGQLGNGPGSASAVPAPVPGLTGVVAIAAGELHSVALRNDGAVLVWGDNSAGQLGESTNPTEPAPLELTTVTGVVAVGAGAHHSLAVLGGGTIRAWGTNTAGQLGLGHSDPVSSPGEVLNVSLGVAVHAGPLGEHSFARESSGSLWAWGPNSIGNLGLGTSSPFEATPQPPTALSSAVSFSSGQDFTLALLSDGSVSSVGANGVGQLGDGTQDDRTTPASVGDLADIIQVSAGAAHGMALGRDGTVYVWGDNSDGQLGDGTLNGSLEPIVLGEPGFSWKAGAPVLSPGPGTYLGFQTVTLTSATEGSTIFYTTDGSAPSPDLSVPNGGSVGIAAPTPLQAVAWKDGLLASDVVVGQYDILPAPPTLSPPGGLYPRVLDVTVECPAGLTAFFTRNGSPPNPSDESLTCGETIFVDSSQTLGVVVLLDGNLSDPAVEAYVIAPSIAAGPRHVLIGGREGQVWAWGENSSGQLGDGTQNATTEPVPVQIDDVVGLAAGGFHSLALESDGSVWAWGENGAGQLGDGSGVAQPVPVAIGLTGIVAIAAGEEHSLALDENGQVWAWGSNASGQLAMGSSPSAETPVLLAAPTSVTAISAGLRHSLALLADGTVQAWGDNSSGQLGDGTFDSRGSAAGVANLAGVVSIGAGDEHSLAVDFTGKLSGWGKGTEGQVGAGTLTSWEGEFADTPWPTTVGICDFGGESGGFLPFETVTIGAGGRAHSTFVHDDGKLASLGLDGASGCAGSDERPLFVDGTVRISSAGDRNLAVDRSGTIWHWEQRETGADYPVRVTDEMGDFLPRPPYFSVAPGMYRTELSVTVTEMTSGSVIHYTMDSSPPDESSPIIASGSSLVITESTFLQAVAIAPDGTASDIRQGMYLLKVPDPVLQPPPSAYHEPQAVEVSVEDVQATLYYSFVSDFPDASDPEVASGSIIPVTPPAELRVGAYRPGWEPSYGGGDYRLGVVTPIIDPPGGSFSEPVTVTITSPTPNATLYYGIDGVWGYVIQSGGSITIGRSATLTVYGFVDGIEDSDIATAEFRFALPAPTLHASRAPGSQDPFHLTAASSVNGATVRCTFDGSEPHPRSTPCTRPLPIDQTVTVRARAYKAGSDPSPVVEGTFTVTPGALATPSFDLASGAYATSRAVTVSGPSGAVIHYTTDGLDPTEADPVVASGSTVTVDESLILKARAWAGGVPSLVARADYRITGAVSVDGWNPHTVLALRTDGTVWSWGRTDEGQTGRDVDDDPLTVPGQVAIDEVVQVAAGARHGLALKKDGSVWSWGTNEFGQLGIDDPSAILRGLPVQVSFSQPAVAIATGSSISALLTESGELWVWGDAPSLPAERFDEAFAPRPISGGACAALFASRLTVHCVDETGAPAQVFAGNDELAPLSSSLPGVLGADDSLYLVDEGGTKGLVRQSGQLALAVPRGSLMSIDAILGDGAVPWAASALRSVRPTSPAYVVSEASPAVGLSASSVIKADGSLWRWGTNADGQLGDDSTTDRAEPGPVPGLSLFTDPWFLDDTDGDGLTNMAEADWGTDPLIADTNGDGIPDGLAIGLGRDPVSVDLDGDGLTNALELQLGTDMLNADSDGDGVGDGADAFPLDPDRSEEPVSDPSDTTPPDIVLTEPEDAVLISTIP
jgi:alpha-tubulin suppressor-like RCC1 family protein